MNSQRNGAVPERVDFSKIKTSIPIPNLIEVQRNSYERFLQMDLLPSERDDTGLDGAGSNGSHAEAPICRLLCAARHGTWLLGSQ